MGIIHRIGDAVDAFRGVKKSFVVGSSNTPTFFSWGNLSDYNTIYTSLDNTKAIYEALTECPQVATILLRKAQAYANGIPKLLSSRGNELPKSNPLYKVINTPNIIQSDNQFRTQLYYYILAYGFCPVMKIKPLGFNDVRSMWILDPATIKITWTKDLPFYKNDINDLIVKVCIQVGNGKEVELDKNDLYFFTDTTGLMKEGFLPVSRLNSLTMPIENLIKNYKSRGRLIEKPFGILSNATKDGISNLPLRPEEKEQLHRDFETHGTGNGKKDVIITNAALTWQMMQYPVEQMQFLDMQDSDTQVLCDALGYPHDLLGNRKGTTFNNKEQSEKTLYVNNTMPDSKNIDQQYNECLELIGTGLEFKVSFEHLPALQADKKLAAETRKVQGQAVIQEYQAGLITQRRALELLGEDTEGVPDEYYKPLENETNNINESGDTSNQGQENQSQEQNNN